MDPDSRGFERWLHDTADLTLAAGADPARWPDVLKAIFDGWPGVKVFFFDGAQPGVASAGGIEYGFSPGFLPAFRDHYSRINPLAPVMARQPVLHADATDNHLPARTFTATEFYNDFVRGEGEIECAAGIKLRHHGDRFAFLAVHYGNRTAERYNRLLPAALQRLAPALDAAIRLNSRLASGLAATPAMAAMLDAVTLPATIVDATARPRLGNAAAAAALDRGDFLRLDISGRLRCPVPGAAPALADAIAAACAPVPSAAEVPVHGRYDNPVAVLSVHPLGAAIDMPSDLAWLVEPDRLALILVRDLQACRSPADQTLQAVFRLTPAEAKLAARLSTGESLTDAADALGIARETARVHLRHIFAKTGTSRQAALVALIARLSQPM